jgi:arginyl-tRNA synthetase
MEERARAEGTVIDDQASGEHLSEPEAWEIATVLSKFPSVLERTALDYEPCNICNYALDLAKAISRAYVKLRVSGEPNKDVARARLTLFVCARTVLATALELLGLKSLQRM